MSVINFPILYIPDSTKGRPLFNGQIFVGEPDLDPEIEINQKQLSIVQEDGTIVGVEQPFILSAGGVPVFNGSPVRLDVDGNYAIKILDKNGSQTYFIENVFDGQVLTINFANSNYIIHDTLAGATSREDLIENKSIIEINDFLGSIFNVVSGQVIDNIDVFAAANGLQLSREFSIKEYRVNINTENGTDQEKIDTALGRGIPVGVTNDITITAPVAMVAGSNLKGVGANLTTINSTDTIIDSTVERIDEILVEGFEFIGPGRNDVSGVASILKQGAQNSTRERFSKMRIRDWPIGISHSAGWGEDYNQLFIIQCGHGFKVELSPIATGWGGSGYVMTNCYFAGCDVGIDDSYIWNATYINAIIEDCTEGYIQNESGTTSVWINPWFEDNASPPKWRRGSVVIGGRGNDFSDVALLVGRPQDAITYIERSEGLKIFRDFTIPTIHVDGQGVKSFVPVFSSLGWEFVDNDDVTAKLLNVSFGGGVTSNSDSQVATEVVTTRLTGKRHFFSSSLADMPELGVEILGSTSSGGSGIGITQIGFSTGTFESGGGGSTSYSRRWRIDQGGHFTPETDITYNIGSASKRVSDIYLENNPIVGSDVRLKKDITNVPQELLDFVLRTKINQYRLIDNTSNRLHFGIIIDEVFLEDLDSIYELDSMGAVCHTTFIDDNGEPYTKRVGDTEIGDLWQVRYAEWQNLFNEGQRRLNLRAAAWERKLQEMYPAAAAEIEIELEIDN